MNNYLIESNINLVSEIAKQFKNSDDEIIQIGMIALWEAAEKWDGVHPFRGWAKRVIKNRMIDYVRKKPPLEEELQDDVPEIQPEDIESEKELRERIKRSFSKRSRERRVLLLMVSGFDKVAIAKRIKVSPKTVIRIAKKAYSQLEEKRRE